MLKNKHVLILSHNILVKFML